MSNTLLNLVGISASVGQKRLLNDINLTINEGELHILMGPNGAGKSTLGNVVMGYPAYTVDSGSIKFLNEDITDMATEKRAKLGLFMTFQNPEEVPGISLENFLRTAKAAVSGEDQNVFIFNQQLKKIMESLAMDTSYANRHLNVGFSGGEKKKSEILQMLALDPRFAILDETDSGLDVDAVRIVSKGIQQYRASHNALLVITHNTKILDELDCDRVHVLVKGRIVADGDASLIREINRHGYAPFIDAEARLA